jgi:acyl-CoA synthetase (AMP-forming)/AMP-acid ligase II
MLKKVSSHRLIVTASSLGSMLEEIRTEMAYSNYAIDIQELPKFPDIYPYLTHETASDPFEKIRLPSHDSFVDGVVLYIHSSGSTGFPKPIPWTHKVLSKITFSSPIDEYRGLEEDIRESYSSCPCASLILVTSHGGTRDA